MGGRIQNMKGRLFTHVRVLLQSRIPLLLPPAYRLVYFPDFCRAALIRSPTGFHSIQSCRLISMYSTSFRHRAASGTTFAGKSSRIEVVVSSSCVLLAMRKAIWPSRDKYQLRKTLAALGCG